MLTFVLVALYYLLLVNLGMEAVSIFISSVYLLMVACSVSTLFLFLFLFVYLKP